MNILYNRLMASCRIRSSRTSSGRRLAHHNLFSIALAASLVAAFVVPGLSAASAGPPASRSKSTGPNGLPRLAQDNQFGQALWTQKGLGSVWVSSPVVATIGRVKAVVLATLTGEIYVFNAKTGHELPGWPQWVHIHSSTPTAVDSSPAVAYLDGPDRPPSIIVGAGSLWRRNQQGGLEAFYANGKVRFVFQTRRTFNPWGSGANDYSDPVFGTPAVGDITGSGQLDIVFGSYDHYIYALKPDGKLVRGFPINRADTIWSSPTLADTSHTGRDDIIIGGDSSGWDGCYGGWLVDYRYGASGPDRVWQRCTSQTIWSSPTVGTLNDSGRLAVVVGTSWNTHYASRPATRQVLAVYADNGRNVPGWPVTTNGPTFGSPAIGRIDGQTAVVSTSCAHCPNGPAMVSAWSGSGRLIWSRAYGGDHEADASPVLVDLTGGRDRGNDVLVGDARGLSLIDGENGDFLYNTGAPRSAVQRGCDVASNPAVAYIPGAPGNGWMMYLACGGPQVPAKLAAYPLPIAPAANDPPAWPEWRANADRTGVPDPFSLPRTTCAHSVVRGKGYRLISGEGAIFDFGNLSYCGGMNETVTPSPVVSMASTPGGRGYWLLLGDGSVYAFGDAKWYGDLRGSGWHGGPLPPGAPVVSIAAAPNGNGYFVVAGNGSVYAFGAAAYHGSRGGKPTDGAVVGIAVDQATGGYWLVTSRGAVYAYGAPYHRSAANLRLVAPVVGIAAPPDGSGYWLAGATGAVYAYGVRLHGSAVRRRLASRVIGIATDSKGEGYWLAEANGAVLRFGDIASFGQVPARAKMRRITAFSGLS